MKLVAKLSNAEIGAYFVLWICSVSYAIWNLYLVSQSINPYNQKYLYFEPGWNLLNNRMKDVSDNEWRLVLIYLPVMLPWVSLHLIIAEFLRFLKYFKLIPLWYICISLTFCWNLFGLTSLIFIIIQPLIYVLLVLLNSNQLTIWLFSIFFIFLINILRFVVHDIFSSIVNNDEDLYYLLMITISWITLKCTSASLDITQEYRNDSKKTEETINTTLMQMVSYIFYLPSLFFGPIHLYCKFESTYSSYENQNWEFRKRYKKLGFNLLRYIGWLFVTEFILHFVYVTVLQLHIEVVEKSFWAVYGLGYSMGQFFQLKYVVMYGLSTSIMKVENFPAPATPTCIGRVHLYSYMWKYFDCGLYSFLLRYIYLPYGDNKKSTLRKLSASFLCFSFSFIWHGMQMFILIWTFLNYVGIVIENFCYWVASTKFFFENFESKLGPRNYRRFTCVISTLLMITSGVSNFFFFGGNEIGLFYVKKLVDGWFFSNFILITCVYFLCQVSTELMQWEYEKKRS